jgi:hypothetical protein
MKTFEFPQTIHRPARKRRRNRRARPAYTLHLVRAVDGLGRYEPTGGCNDGPAPYGAVYLRPGDLSTDSGFLCWVKPVTPFDE